MFKKLFILIFFLSDAFALFNLFKSKTQTFHLTGNKIGWPCEATKNIYTNTGRYIPKSIIATRCQIYKNTAFVALPRYKCGIPFTLGKVCLLTNPSWAKIEPWPCWSIQEEGNCEALQNVVDLYLDGQGILWCLDIGICNTLQQPIKRCEPKVVAFNAFTGKLVKTINLAGLVTPCSRLQYIVVDHSKIGERYIYISDAGGRAIIVYDINLSKGYRVVLPNTCISKAPRCDVLYITLVHTKLKKSVLYFTYLGSSHLYSIKTEHLRQGKGSGAVIDVGSKPNGKPIVLLGTDNGHAIFMRYKGESDVFMWSSDTSFKLNNFIPIQKGHEDRLPTQVIAGHKNHIMWTIESDFYNYISNKCGSYGASVVLHPVVREINC